MPEADKPMPPPQAKPKQATPPSAQDRAARAAIATTRGRAPIVLSTFPSLTPAGARPRPASCLADSTAPTPLGSHLQAGSTPRGGRVGRQPKTDLLQQRLPLSLSRRWPRVFAAWRTTPAL